MKRTLSPGIKSNVVLYDDIILNFEHKGEDFGDQERNSLKLFEMPEGLINVKSFKVPNLVIELHIGF